MPTHKSFALSLLLPLLLTLGGCDFIYGLLHKEGAQEKEIIGKATPLEKNANIEEVQTLLKFYGYDPGPIDGVLGRRTRDAIERFQKENDLTPSRFVDQETWKKLSVFNAKGFIAEGRLNVRKVQTILKEAGYDPGPVDGKLGSKTKSAISAFQKAHRLKADGKVGYRTLTALSMYSP